MSRTRSLLFYVRSEKTGVTSYPGGGYDIHNTVRDVFNLRLRIHKLIESKKQKLSDSTDYSTEYQFYDWDLKEIKSDLRVSRVPKPGIIIVVSNQCKEPIYAYAYHTKRVVRNTSDSDQLEILKSFTEGPEGKFEPFLYDVFLSYVEEDMELAQELYELLTQSGLNCFMDKKSLDVGTIWEDDIRKALVNSLAEVILLTPNSIKSLWVMCEAGACWVLEKQIFPAIISIKHEDLPEPIKKYQCIQIETVENRNKLKDAVVHYCGI